MRLTALPGRLLEVSSVLARWVALELPSHRRRPAVAQARARHLLMLADQFPPMVSGGVYRPLSFAAAAGGLGWEMTVVTQATGAEVSDVGRALEGSVPPEVRVHRVAPIATSLPAGGSLEVDGGFENALAMVAVALRLPDGPPSAVLATGPHFHTFVAGFLLKKALGVPLVLDYRDEWSECPFNFVRKGPADRWWERRCLAAADRVVFTTPTMREHALRSFPGLAPEKAVVIENGVVGEELMDAPEEGREGTIPGWEEEEGRLAIGFMGNLSGHTDPGSFLRALGRVLERRPEFAERLRLLWVGTVRPRQRALIGELDTAGLSRTVPQLSRADAQRLMHRCSLLLLIVNEDMDRYRPGKLYSYLASGTPILVYGSDGESGGIVRSLAAGMVVADGDDVALEGAIAGALDGGVTMANGSRRDAWIRSMDRRMLAGRLFRLLEGLAVYDGGARAGT